MKQDYFLGLDMGTGSLGWAVTDSTYQVMRKHGKALWGTRLFESASTAEERRMFRTARRRLDRRNWRIQVLQEIFSEEISKVDPGFFLRMKESKYYPDDKRDAEGNCPELPYALFVDDNYTDKDYHKDYPTIYHLRKMLMETTEIPDIRLVYLVLHHMMKHRGHFLLSGDISQIKEFKSTFEQLIQNIQDEELEWHISLDDAAMQFVEHILKDRNLTRSTKKSRLIKQLNAKSACEKAILNLLSGGTVKLSDIFNNKELDESERPKVSFADSGYDDYIGIVEAELAEQYYIIASAKAVYDWSVLVEILGNSVSISEAKIKVYQKHQADLKTLKKIVRQYMTKEDYKRSDSRKKQLVELYRACKNEEREWITELNAQSDQQLRSDKLFLYYIQKGRCMYSGETIQLDELWDNTKYDIDHIYPQSKTMDDSLNNRVLVKKNYNAIKSDTYPLSLDIQKKMMSFWKMLQQQGFITKEKYVRLVRSDELSADELAGFIERQIVETRQSTKAVATILKEALPDTEIVYVKAGNVSNFRQTYELLKVREMNDLHHAKDAYLNIVVGNAYFVKFTKNAAWFIRNNPGRSYNLKRMFEFDIERSGEIAWKAGNNGSIVTVKKVMQKNNILVTRKAYEVKGGLFDQQIMKKGKGQVPIKGNDERLANIEKYGGYNKAATTYFMLVKSLDKKGKEIRTIEFVPLYLKNQIEINHESAIQYLAQERGLNSPEILLSKIKIDTLFKVDGFKMWLSGRTGNQLTFKGANQLILSHQEAEILKGVVKYVNRKNENKDAKLSERDGMTEEKLLQLYDTFLDKLSNTVYSIRLSAQIKTLTEKRAKFIGLSNEDQCIVLNEILHMFQCQSGSANLKLIGGPGSAGILVMNNNITARKQISVINQSPTGIYEKEIDLMKL